MTPTTQDNIWCVTVTFYDGDCDEYARPRASTIQREQCAPSPEAAQRIVLATIDAEPITVEVEATYDVVWGDGTASCLA